eukprot:gene12918-17313_t
MCRVLIAVLMVLVDVQRTLSLLHYFQSPTTKRFKSRSAFTYQQSTPFRKPFEFYSTLSPIPSQLWRNLRNEKDVNPFAFSIKQQRDDSYDKLIYIVSSNSLVFPFLSSFLRRCESNTLLTPNVRLTNIGPSFLHSVLNMLNEQNNFNEYIELLISYHECTLVNCNIGIKEGYIQNKKKLNKMVIASPVHYDIAINNCNSDPTIVMKLYNQIKQLRFESKLSLNSYTNIISALGKHKNYDEVLYLYTNILLKNKISKIITEKSAIQTNNRLFTSILSALSGSNMIEQSENIFHFMLEINRNNNNNNNSNNNINNNNNNQNQVRLNDLRYAYKSMIFLYGNNNDWQKALNWFANMENDPSIEIDRTAICMMMKILNKAKKWDKAAEIKQKYPIISKFSINSNNNSQIPVAQKVNNDDLVEKPILPFVPFSDLIREAKRSGDYRDAVRIVKSWLLRLEAILSQTTIQSNDKNYILTKTSIPTYKYSAGALTSCITILGNAGEWRSCLHVLKLIKSIIGESPNIFQYNAVMSSLIHSNRTKEMFEIYDEIKNSNDVSPTGYTYGILLLAMERNGMVSESIELFNKLNAIEYNNITKNTIMYNTLLSTLGKGLEWQKCLSLYDEMIANNITVDHITQYNILNALELSKQWDLYDDYKLEFNMMKSIKDARFQGFKFISKNNIINSNSYSIFNSTSFDAMNNITLYDNFIQQSDEENLLKILSYANRLEEVLYLMKKLETAGRKVSVATYHATITGFDFSGNWQGAMQMLSLMKKNNVARNSTTYKLLFTMLRKYSNDPAIASVARHVQQQGIADGILLTNNTN